MQDGGVKVRNDKDYLKDYLEPISRNEFINELFNTLVKFWKSNRKKYPVRLAHGPYHLTATAYKAYTIARYNGIDANEAYIAGLLHEPYRPVEVIEDISEEEHAGISRELASMIIDKTLDEAQTELDKDKILDAIERHHTGENMKTMLDKVLYIADKSQMNEERVFAYVYDFNHQCEIQDKTDKKLKNLADVLRAYMKRMYRVRKAIPPIIGFTLAIDSYSETLEVLSVLTRREAQEDITLNDCIEMYALRESLLNLAILGLMDIKVDIAYEILGEYNTLLNDLRKGTRMKYLSNYYNFMDSYREQP